MEFEADLGKWERGITVEFEADSMKEALQKADEFLQKEIASKNLEANADIVQIKLRNGPCVYDYMNGTGIYADTIESLGLK